MKKIFLLTIFLLTFLSSPKAQYGNISFQTFYDELSPYGTWANYPGYGYVWAPNVGRGFQPYGTNGYWVYTSYGWTWVSDYYWGWAPFHYGRWIFDNYRGWLWIPGYDWGPGWVVWGNYGDNYCWAPLGYGINVSPGFGWWPPAMNWWVSVPRNRFYNHNWYNYRVPPPRSHGNIRVMNDVYNERGGGRPTAWQRGPRVNEVENYSRTRIRPLNVSAANNPGISNVDRNNVNIYRPAVEKRPDNNTRPARPQPFNQVRPIQNLPTKDPDVNFRPAPVTPRPAQPEQPGIQPARPMPSRPLPQTQPSRPVIEQMPSRSVPQTQPTRPVAEPIPSRPLPQSQPTRPAPQPIPSRPLPQTQPSRPASQPMQSRPVPQSQPSRPASQPMPSRPVPQSQPSRPVYQPMQSRPVPQTQPSRPAPMPSRPAPAPMPQPSRPSPPPMQSRPAPQPHPSAPPAHR